MICDDDVHDANAREIARLSARLHETSRYPIVPAQERIIPAQYWQRGKMFRKQVEEREALIGAVEKALADYREAQCQYETSVMFRHNPMYKDDPEYQGMPEATDEYQRECLHRSDLALDRLAEAAVLARNTFIEKSL